MASYDLNTAKQRVTDYATPKYGRGPNSDQEWQSIAQGINYQDGVDDNELSQAYGNVDALAKSYGATPQQQTPAQPAPQTSANVPQNLQATVGGLFNERPASPVQSAYQDSLLGMMRSAQQPVSLNDSTLAPQMDAFRVGQQRSAERQRGAAAERAAATGTSNSGAFGRQVQQIEAQKGLNESAFGANLVGQEQNARRQQLTQALQLAQATGNSEAARQLQTQLALLGASTDESQFGRELGFRESALSQQGKLGQGELALRLLGLMTGNQYNYDALGSNNAFRMADLNQRTIQSLLGGF